MNNEDQFQDMMAQIKAEMNEMDKCPNCKKDKACKKHLALFGDVEK